MTLMAGLITAGYAGVAVILTSTVRDANALKKQIKEIEQKGEASELYNCMHDLKLDNVEKSTQQIGKEFKKIQKLVDHNIK